MNVFNEKVVLITGGGAGIGRAAALRFAEQGARVVITGRRLDPLTALAKEQPNIDFIIADAGNSADAAKTIDTVIERWGRLDVLINNAGAGVIMPLEKATVEFIREIFTVNVIGASLLATAAIPHLRTSKGSIINISSTFGHKPAGSLSHYAASKAALEHMTRCWALELAVDGIRVNAVAAGPTETEFLTTRMGLSKEEAEEVKTQERTRIPLGRRGVPEDVAAWVVSLASPTAEWITGQILTVDGGLDIT